jgi:hypothetical protein
VRPVSVNRLETGGRRLDEEMARALPDVQNA